MKKVVHYTRGRTGCLRLASSLASRSKASRSLSVLANVSLIATIESTVSSIALIDLAHAALAKRANYAVAPFQNGGTREHRKALAVRLSRELARQEQAQLVSLNLVLLIGRQQQ